MAAIGTKTGGGGGGVAGRGGGSQDASERPIERRQGMANKRRNMLHLPDGSRRTWRPLAILKHHHPN